MASEFDGTDYENLSDGREIYIADILINTNYLTIKKGILTQTSSDEDDYMFHG